MVSKELTTMAVLPVMTIGMKATKRIGTMKAAKVISAITVTTTIVKTVTMELNSLFKAILVRSTIIEMNTASGREINSNDCFKKKDKYEFLSLLRFLNYETLIFS